MPEPGPRNLAEFEFAALRATIRERGTVRIWVAVLTILVWAALTVALSAANGLPVFSLIGALVLAAGFETTFQLHVGIERIGRYLQVFYEGDPSTTHGPRWESTAMAYGLTYPGSGPDPLFSVAFLIANALNYLPVALVGTAPELIGLGAAHLLLPCRILVARRAAGRQRNADLERFRALFLRERDGEERRADRPLP